MFNTSEPLTFTFVDRSGSSVSIAVRWPLDFHWIKRQRAVGQRVKILSGGRSTPLPVDDAKALAADLELFSHICVSPENPEDVDPRFACRVIEQLGIGSVSEVKFFGGQYTVTLLAGSSAERTTHVLTEPTYAMERKWRSRGQGTVLIRGTEYEVHANYHLAGELYDQLLVSNGGYVGPVPIEHKLAVVTRVFAEQQSIDSPAVAEATEDLTDDDLGF